MNRRKLQSGQTLIETVVAVFILVMGITAAVGLAVYSLRSSQGSADQIIAMGLAREGVEAVKWMRDSNWLILRNPDNNCFNYLSGGQNAICYRQWLRPPGANGTPGRGFDISFPGTSNYTVTFGLSGPMGNNGDYPYMLTSSPVSYSADLNNTDSGNGFYSFNGTVNGSSKFYRQIQIVQDNSAPYNVADVGPRILVKSRAWWWGKTCGNRSANWPGQGPCAIELQAYLTNWKSY